MAKFSRAILPLLLAQVGQKHIRLAHAAGGLAAIALVLEATRRTAGPSLAIIALAEGLAFTIVGDGTHRDLEPGRVSPFAAAEDRLAAIGSALSITQEHGGGAAISFVVPSRVAA